MTHRRLDLFATPVFLFHHPDPESVNPALRAHFLERREREPSFGVSNIGGWHSPPDVASDPSAAVQALCRWVLDCFSRALTDVSGQALDDMGLVRGLQAWAMVMTHGAYSALHDHADAVWSGVYYVDMGDATPAPSGRLGLVDPRGGIARRWPLPMFSPDVIVEPQAGRLVLFPSWLRHQVFPYQGEAPRISVSWNLLLRPA
jgi:uncharacterized protein (TIGR02466 family)